MSAVKVVEREVGGKLVRCLEFEGQPTAEEIAGALDDNGLSTRALTIDRFPYRIETHPGLVGFYGGLGMLVNELEKPGFVMPSFRELVRRYQEWRALHVKDGR